MTLQFELPQSNRSLVVLIGSVILALALWPLLERTIDRLMPGSVLPAASSQKSTGGSAFDLRSMWR